MKDFILNNLHVFFLVAVWSILLYISNNALPSFLVFGIGFMIALTVRKGTTQYRESDA